MNYSRVILAIVAAVLLCACKKQVACVPPFLRYSFKGFDSSELVVVRQLRYEQGSHFQKLVSERIASSKSNLPRPNDTIPFHLFGPSQEYDEIILLPYAGGREFRIREISLGNETQSLGIISAVEDQCAVSCSLYLNDSLISFSDWPPSNQSTKTDIILLQK